jgi:NADH-quinone oxidoreductase subunit M
MATDPAFPFLTTLVLLPAGAALLCALLPKAASERSLRWMVFGVGTTAMAATLALALTIMVRFHGGYAGFQMQTTYRWIPQLGVSWHLGVDGISLFLLVMSGVLFPLALLGATVRHKPRSYVAWLLLLEAACMGSFVSLDLILFFVYTFLGSAFLLVGIVTVAVIHDSQTGHLTFDLLALERTHLGLTDQLLLFGAFTAAFAVKAPVFPFHTWSPDAYGSSPTGGAVILAGIMAKLGTYGVIRFDLTLFPRAVVDLAPVLLTLGVVGIIYGAVVAAVQRDLKRLVAYSSLAHIGFIVLGMFALTTQAVTGGVLQMVNHGLVTAALFLLIGWIWDRRGSWRTDELRGLQRPAPVLAGCFTVAMMASIGLPGLNGFVGEFLVLSGTFLTHRWWAVAATVGVVLAAVYLLWAFQQAFHHAPRPVDERTRDLGWREVAIMAPLVGLIVFLGVYPKPVLDRITPSVAALVQHVDIGGHTRQPAVASGGTAALQPPVAAPGTAAVSAAHRGRACGPVAPTGPGTSTTGSGAVGTAPNAPGAGAAGCHATLTSTNGRLP